MRMRVSVIGATLVAMLLAIPVAATAQDAGCTGEITLAEQADGTIHLWSADDERLSGEVRSDEGWSFYETASEVRGEVSETATYEIGNADGTWRCIASLPAGPEPDLDGHHLVFVGHGAYDGLHAFVTVNWSEGASPFSGFITATEPPADPVLAG